MRYVGFIAVVSLACCSIGEEQAATEDTDQWAIGRPLKNGCSPQSTAFECAAQKGVSPALACAFLYRADNAYFKLGSAAEANAHWQVEQEAPLLAWDYYASRLETGCTVARQSATPGYLAVLIPTEAGCVQAVGGTWKNGYCSGDTAALPPPEDVHFTGEVAPGVPRVLPVIPVRPGARINIGMVGTGDPDLYVRFGDPATTPYDADCRDTRGDGFGLCRLTVPLGVDRVFVTVYAPQVHSTFGVTAEYE